MSASTGPIVPRRRLGAELRTLRETAGLLLEDIAEKLECSASKVSRLEMGKGIPKARDVRDMLEAYGVTDRATRDRLLRLAREGQQQGWWSEYSDVLQPDTLLPDHLDRLVALETEATTVQEYQQSVVPGLLQTGPYARAIITELNSRYDREQVDRLVALRMKRQDALARKAEPLRMQVVLDESVLRRRIGGTEVLRAQLRGLLRSARRRTVRMRVLPYAAGVHSAIAGTFQLLHFESEADRDVVYLESHTRDTYLESRPDVATYEQLFYSITRLALPEAESVEFIQRAIDDLP